MADRNSLTDGGLPHRNRDRILGSRRLRSTDKRSHMQEEWDKHYAGWANDRIYKPNKSMRQHEWPTSECSDKSSTTMQSLQSSASLSNSGELQHILMSAVPRVDNSPPLPQRTAINLQPQIGAPRATSNTSPKNSSGMADDPLEDAKKKQPATEIHRSPSPRIQMNIYRAEYPRHQTETRIGEMDRFLAHQDDDFDGDPVQVAEEWRKLRSLIPRALRLRSRLRNKRLDLHERQLVKSAADEAFMKHVRENRVSPAAPAASDSMLASMSDVDGLYTAMQNARDDYGECEYEYSELQESLDETEFQLAKTERHLWGTKANEMPHDEIADLTLKGSESITSSNPDSLLGISSSHVGDYNPLEANFLSRLGDLDLAKEQYENMVLERDRLLSRQASRLPVGLDLQDDEKRFLLEFRKNEATIQEEIAGIEADVQIAKEECLAAGLDITAGNNWNEQESDKGDKPRSSQVDGAPKGDESDFIPETTPTSSYSTFSLILPSPLAVLAVSKIKISFGDLVTEFDEKNKGDRIRRWLLHKLRTSPMEVELLVRVFLQIVHLFSFQQWRTDIIQFQQNVLSLWEKDRSNKDQGAFKPIPTPSLHDSNSSSLLLNHENQESRILLGKTARKESYVRRVKSAPGAFKSRREAHEDFRILPTEEF